jgi:hypothetical protein
MLTLLDLVFFSFSSLKARKDRICQRMSKCSRWKLKSDTRSSEPSRILKKNKTHELYIVLIRRISAECNIGLPQFPPYKIVLLCVHGERHL